MKYRKNNYNFYYMLFMKGGTLLELSEIKNVFIDFIIVFIEIKTIFLNKNVGTFKCSISRVL